MTNLVPERRTDKNGVTSVRWVKPQEIATSSISGMPAPVMPSSNKQRPEDRQIIHALYIRRVSAGEQMKLQANVKFLNAKCPDLMDRIVTACEDDDGEERVVWLSKLTREHLGPHRGRTEEESRRELERSLTVFPLILRIAKGRVHDSWYTDYMRSYDNIVEVMIEESGSAASQSEIEAMTVAAFFCGVRPNDDFGIEKVIATNTYAKIKNDLGYIAEHQEEVEGVIDVLRERRGEYSSGLVRELVGNKSAAMIDGVL